MYVRSSDANAPSCISVLLINVFQEFTVHTDFTCALTFDIVPKYIDYYVEILSGGNGHGGPILLARREFHQSATLPPTDTFTTTVCLAVRLSA